MQQSSSKNTVKYIILIILSIAVLSSLLKTFSSDRSPSVPPEPSGETDPVRKNPSTEAPQSVHKHHFEKGLCIDCGETDPTIGTLNNPFPADNDLTITCPEFCYSSYAFGNVLTFNVKCLECLRGEEINSLIASESKTNDIPNENQEWVLLHFGVTCLDSESGNELQTAMLFSQNSFYTAQGASLAIFDTARFGTHLGAHSYEKVRLYPGAYGEVAVGILIEKGVGDLVLKIPVQGGLIWLSCSPVAWRQAEYPF